MSASASTRAKVQLWGGIALGLGALTWFLWSIEWAALGGVLARVQWRWVFVASAVMLGNYALHAARWKVLLLHVDPDLPARTVWRATTVLWAFNTLLPLRAGNLLRPAVVSLTRRVPYTTLLFTMIAEAVLDVFGIVVMVLVMLQSLPDELVQSGPLVQMRRYGSVAPAVALVALACIVLLSTRRARSLVARLVSPLPSRRVRLALLRLFSQLVEGLAAVGHPVRFLTSMGLTLAMWFGWLLSILATLRAFELEIPLAGALFMETALTLSMLLPQAPGFLGVFQVVTEQALGLFGAPAAEAKGIALLFWTVCFVPITVLGAWDAWRLGIGPSGTPRKPARKRDAPQQLTDADTRG